MPSYYPLFVNIEGKRCVVVGGGAVAERKVRSLLEHGASVTVISPAVCEGLSALEKQGRIGVQRRDYRRGDLEGAVIAIASTDDRRVNGSVSEDARERRVPVNVVDDPELSSFIVPSLVRRGDVSIAISTGGRSPALARRIRAELEREFPPEYESLAVLISEVRGELKRRGARIDGETWQEHLDLDLLLRMLNKGKFEEAKAELLASLVGSVPGKP